VKKAFLIFILILSASAAFAVNGTTLDPSLNLFSARQMGMGGVSIGFANDANGVFTNPSGLVKLDFPQLTASSRKIMMDETQYSLLSWALPTNYGTFGIGYVGMGSGGSLPSMLDPATGRIIINPSLEAGSYSNSVVAFSYAKEIYIKQLNKDVALGGNLKFFNQSLSGGGAADSATGMGIDLSANYRPLPWLKVGTTLQNILGGSVKWSSSQDKVGGYYKLGSEINLLGASEEALKPYPQVLKAGIDLDLPSSVLAASNSMLYHLGLEYFPQKNIALRAGINQETNGSGLTLGVGVVNGGFRFDYAFVQRPGLPGDTPHYFSLSYVGERVLSVFRKIKSKLAHLKILSPRDRLITDQDFIDVSGEAWGEKTYDQKRVWTVTSISATQDAFEVTEREPLSLLQLDGQPVEQGTVEARTTLKHGRNVVQLFGVTSPEISAEATMASVVNTTEVKVLKILPFSDVSMESWALEPIYLNVVMGMITGYPDNSFKPEKGITRAELVALLVRSLGLPADTLDPYASFEVFSDVKPKHWAAKYIIYGSTLKYVTGYPDGTFKPNKVLTRAEGITILSRYASLAEEMGITQAPFSDLKVDFWANKYIIPAKAAGMLKYLEGQEFKASAPFSRAEASEVLYRVPAIQKKAEQFWNSGVISATQ
jgi:hypothetical protein